MDDGVRLPNQTQSSSPAPSAESLFVPSVQARERRSRRWLLIGVGLLSLVAIGAVIAMVYRPRLKPRPLDAVEAVAASYLDALVRQDEDVAQKLGTVEEPPGIASSGDIVHDKVRDHQIRGSFATLAGLHKRIDGEFTYDATAGRFTPRNALGIAGDTLDALHAAKDDAEKSGMYAKMQSGDPNDIFDSAEQLGKVFENLSKNMLAPKKILPTYKMLVESSRPPLSDDAKAMAMAVADDPKQWSALLKRPFWTLKPDGPFVYDEAEVTATVRDRLASLGDPPSKLRLKLVRFRLEGIDTGWKVVEARRVQPSDDQAEATASGSSVFSSDTGRRSPGEAPSPGSPTRSAPAAAPKAKAPVF